jgi:hypothetical protein
VVGCWIGKFAQNFPHVTATTWSLDERGEYAVLGCSRFSPSRSRFACLGSMWRGHHRAARCRPRGQNGWFHRVQDNGFAGGRRTYKGCCLHKHPTMSKLQAPTSTKCKRKFYRISGRRRDRDSQRRLGVAKTLPADKGLPSHEEQQVLFQEIFRCHWHMLIEDFHCFAVVKPFKYPAFVLSGLFSHAMTNTPKTRGLNRQLNNTICFSNPSISRFCRDVGFKLVFVIYLESKEIHFFDELQRKFDTLYIP